MPLLVSDLPVFLRWRGPAALRRAGARAARRRRRPAGRGLARVARARARDLARLPELCDRIAVSDIAWARTEPWRAAVADLWPGVAEASGLRVAGPEPEALLLQAGSRPDSAARSGWSTSRPARSSSSRWTGARYVRRGSSRRRPATCSRTSSRSSAATGSSRRPYGASRRPGPGASSHPGWIAERARGRSPFRIALTGGTRRRGRLRAARRARARLAFLAGLVERRARRPARAPGLERAPGPRGPALRVPIPEGADPPAPRSRTSSCRDAFDLVLLGRRQRRPHGLALPRPRRGAADPGPLVYVPEPGLPPPHPRISFSLAVPERAAAGRLSRRRGGQARDPRAHPGGRRGTPRGAGPRGGDGRPRRHGGRPQVTDCYLARALLERLADGEDERVIARAGGDLQRRREAVLGRAAREGERRPAGCVERPREQIMRSRRTRSPVPTGGATIGIVGVSRTSKPSSASSARSR